MNKNILINIGSENLMEKKVKGIKDISFPEIELKDYVLKKTYDICRNDLLKTKSIKHVVHKLIKEFCEFDSMFLSLSSAYVALNATKFKTIKLKDTLFEKYSDVDVNELFLIFKEYYPVLNYLYQSDIIDLIKRTPGVLFNKHNKIFAERFLFISSLIRAVSATFKDSIEKDEDMDQLDSKQMELIKKFEIKDNFHLSDRIIKNSRYKTLILDKCDTVNNLSSYYKNLNDGNIKKNEVLEKFVKSIYSAYTGKGIFSKLGSISYVTNNYNLNISSMTVINIEEIVDIKTFRDRDWIYDIFMSINALKEYDEFYYDAVRYVQFNISSKMITGFDFSVLLYQLSNGVVKHLILPTEDSMENLNKRVFEIAVNELFKQYMVTFIRLTEIFSNKNFNTKDLNIELSIKTEDLSKDHVAKSKVMTERHYKNQTILVNGHIRTYKNGDQTLVCSHLRNYGEADKKRILSSAYTVISLNK